MKEQIQAATRMNPTRPKGMLNLNTSIKDEGKGNLFCMHLFNCIRVLIFEVQLTMCFHSSESGEKHEIHDVIV